MNLSLPRRMLVAVAMGAAPLLASSSAPVSTREMPKLLIDDSPIAQTAVVASYADVLEEARRAVVTIYATKNLTGDAALAHQLFGEAFPDGRPSQQGLGSGVIVSADGYILTNSHVVSGADRIEVIHTGTQRIKATLIGADPKTDIAVIKIDGAALPVATLADSDKIRVGDVVFAIGNPLAVGQTVTMGIVSAKGRQVGLLSNEDIKGYEDFIQTDAAINMGNSGGALVDAKGRLIGINSAILSTARGDVGGSIGIGFSVPVNLATNIMENLIRTGKVSRGYLGIEADDLAPDLIGSFKLPAGSKGVVVMKVDADAPAAKAGLKADDVVVAIDDRPVTSEAELGLAISQRPPESRVRVRFFRDGKEDTVEATLAVLEEDSGKPNELLPGVTVAGLTTESRRRLRLNDGTDGLHITAVADNSDYSSQLKTGMVITRINNDPVTDLAKARKAIQPGTINRFYVYAGESFTLLGIEVK
jgi:serine protease Do/serine protease DegQ